MLLDNNSKNVINIIEKFDNLNNVDKIRLVLHLIVLNSLDSNYGKVITNFGKYKNLLFFSQIFRFE